MAIPNPSDLKERLRAVRASQKDLADFMGIGIKSVNRIVNPDGPDGRKKLSTKEFEQINSFFEMREKPAYIPSNEGSAHRGSGVGLGGDRSTIPLFTGIDAKEGYTLSVAAFAQHGRVLAHPSQASAREAYAVTVIDDAMSPRFEAGEYAYVIPNQPPRRGQDCLLENDDMTARILQFVERGEKQVVFKQLNPPKEIHRRVGDRFKVHAIVGRG